MQVKFWGVRGSIPCPGLETVRYGGNTACIELRFDDTERLIIIDAGSGIRELGDHLLKHDLQHRAIRADIFLTHTHWDHIMGLPFFAPIYLSDSSFTIYGPVTFEEENLKNVLRGQWAYRYFPVRVDELTSQIEYVELKEGEYDLGQGLVVRTKYLNHPLLCLGYRFEYEGKALCTAFDTEPFRNVFAIDPSHPEYDPLIVMEGEKVSTEENHRIEQFVSGADLLIFDSQYSQSEYDQNYVGWGHSPIEYALAVAQRNQVSA